MRVEFFVPGLPAPQGSKRAFVNRITGKAQMLESSKKVAPWRNDIAASAMRAMEGHERAPAGMAVAVAVDFFMPRPASHIGKGGSRKKGRPARPVGKPDADKLLRSVLDALTGIAFDDDSQVVDAHPQKFYTRETPGARITITSSDTNDETGAP